MTRRGAGIAVAALAAAACAACTARDTVATSGAAGDSIAEYCGGDGPPLEVGGTCVYHLAATVFSHAVCGCDGLTLDPELKTDGWDSRSGEFEPDGEGGEVASDVFIHANSRMTVGSTLTVSGAAGIEAGPDLEVRGDLRSGGPLGGASSEIDVKGNASVAGSVMVGTMTIGEEGTGALTTPSAAGVTGQVNGRVVEGPVSVPQPCSCDQAQLMTDEVGRRALVNDDAELNFEPDRLVNVDGDDELPLPCGRFYLDEISGATEGKTVTLHVTGRASLFVGGNINLKQALTIAIDDGAELDLFVKGFIQAGVSLLGDPVRPRALRIYVASDGSLNLPDGSRLAGNLYAPTTDLNSPVPLEMYGALVVRHLNGTGSVTVHYDTGIVSGGDDCQ
jgi:hypothetical protein